MIYTVFRAALALAATLIPINAATAYEVLTYQGQELRWQEPVIPFYVNPTGSGLTQDEVVRVATDATLAWEAIHFGLRFEYMGTTQIREAPTEGDEGLNVIYFISDSNVWQQTFPGQDTALAMTRSRSLKSGELVGFDMAFNAARWTFSTSSSPGTHDLQNTLTHELGHVLGLDHSDVESATMYTTAPLGELEKSSLDPDDVSGIRYLYAQGFSEPQEVFAFGCTYQPGQPLSRREDKHIPGRMSAIIGLLLSSIPAVRFIRRVSC